MNICDKMSVAKVVSPENSNSHFGTFLETLWKRSLRGAF